MGFSLIPRVWFVEAGARALNCTILLRSICTHNPSLGIMLSLALVQRKSLHQCHFTNSYPLRFIFSQIANNINFHVYGFLRRELVHSTVPSYYYRLTLYYIWFWCKQLHQCHFTNSYPLRLIFSQIVNNINFSEDEA